jgi:hypothetical protein
MSNETKSSNGSISLLTLLAGIVVGLALFWFWTTKTAAGRAYMDQQLGLVDLRRRVMQLESENQTLKAEGRHTETGVSGIF